MGEQFVSFVCQNSNEKLVGFFSFQRSFKGKTVKPWGKTIPKQTMIDSLRSFEFNGFW